MWETDLHFLAVERLWAYADLATMIMLLLLEGICATNKDFRYMLLCVVAGGGGGGFVEEAHISEVNL